MGVKQTSGWLCGHRRQPAALAATLDIDQLEIGPMLDQLGYQRSVEGNLDAAFNLDGSGNSVAALMAGLNGNIRIAMSNGRVASRYLELLEKYLGGGILQMLNPFEEKREYTPVNCFVDNIEIKDGLADVKMLLDTDRTSIFGAGDVNLKTEAFESGHQADTQKGSHACRHQLQLQGIVPTVSPGRYPRQPTPRHRSRPDGVRNRQNGRRPGIGTDRLAAFFADVSLGKKDPCAVALGKADIKDQSSDAKKPDEKKKEKKSDGFFKRLFGK